LVMTVQALPKMAINDGVLELCKVLDKAQVPRYDGAHPCFLLFAKLLRMSCHPASADRHFLGCTGHF